MTEVQEALTRRKSTARTTEKWGQVLRIKKFQCPALLQECIICNLWVSLRKSQEILTLGDQLGDDWREFVGGPNQIINHDSSHYQQFFVSESHIYDPLSKFWIVFYLLFCVKSLLFYKDIYFSSQYLFIVTRNTILVESRIPLVGKSSGLSLPSKFESFSIWYNL